jgi:glycosyltransferase involved in cell wall biosynthesis
MIVKKNPDLTFKLLGKNWMESEFSELINDFKNLEYVEINGALNSSDFDGCSTLLVTSEIEGGPMPIIEALASGIYPIGTDTGFLGDIQEFLGLPKSFVLPEVDDISLALRGRLNDSAGISPAFREKILSLDFERLAKIIHVNLKNFTN